MRDALVNNEALAAHALRLGLQHRLRALPYEPGRALRQQRLGEEGTGEEAREDGGGDEEAGGEGKGGKDGATLGDPYATRVLQVGCKTFGWGAQKDCGGAGSGCA